MKTRLTMLLFAAAVAVASVSCSAFTAPEDPVTGIRQDTPEDWSKEAPNPLDTPETVYRTPPAYGHWGPFGEAPAAWRSF